MGSDTPLYSLGNIATGLLQGYRTGVSDKLRQEQFDLINRKNEFAEKMALEKLDIFKKTSEKGLEKMDLMNERLREELDFMRKVEDDRAKIIQETAEKANLQNQIMKSKLDELGFQIDRLKLDLFNNTAKNILDTYASEYQDKGTKNIEKFNMLLRRDYDKGIIKFISEVDEENLIPSRFVTPEVISKEGLLDKVTSHPKYSEYVANGVNIVREKTEERIVGGKKQTLKSYEINPHFAIIEYVDRDNPENKQYVPFNLALFASAVGSDKYKDLLNKLNAEKKMEEINLIKAKIKKTTAETQKVKEDNSIMRDIVKKSGDIIRDVYIFGEYEPANQFTQFWLKQLYGTSPKSLMGGEKGVSAGNEKNEKTVAPKKKTKEELRSEIMGKVGKVLNNIETK